MLEQCCQASEEYQIYYSHHAMMNVSGMKRKLNFQFSKIYIIHGYTVMLGPGFTFLVSHRKILRSTESHCCTKLSLNNKSPS